MTGLAVLVTTAFWPGLMGAALAPRWAVLAAGVPLLLWLAPAPLWRPCYSAWLVTLACGVIGLAWSPDPWAGAGVLIHLAILFGAFALGAVYGAEAIMAGIALGLVPSIVLVVGQFWGWSPVEQFSPPAGLFFNKNTLAELAGPVLVWAVLRHRYWLCVAPGLALLFCHGRGAWLAVAAVFCPLRWLAMLAAAAVVVMLITGLDSSAERIEIWRAAVSGLVPFGAGPGGFTARYPVWEHVHCDALELIHDFGAGGVPLLGVLVMALMGGSDAERRALAAVLLESLVSFPLQLPTSGFMAAGLAGSLHGSGYFVWRGRAQCRTRHHGADRVAGDGGLAVCQITQSHLSVSVRPQAAPGRGQD